MPNVSMLPASLHPAPRRVLLATSDPMFAAVCKEAFELAANPEPFLAVPPRDLLDTARQFAPDIVVLDADGQDVAAFKALAAKLLLVRDASLVLVSAYLAPGSPALRALLQSVPAAFVQKPRGPSSLSLAGADGPPFVAAVKSGFVASEDPDDIAVEGVDAGWDTEEEPGHP